MDHTVLPANTPCLPFIITLFLSFCVLSVYSTVHSQPPIEWSVWAMLTALVGVWLSNVVLEGCLQLRNPVPFRCSLWPSLGDAIKILLALAFSCIYVMCHEWARSSTWIVAAIHYCVPVEYLYIVDCLRMEPFCWWKFLCCRFWPVTGRCSREAESEPKYSQTMPWP